MIFGEGKGSFLATMKESRKKEEKASSKQKEGLPCHSIGSVRSF
jgi:hypothetical protein